MKTFLKLIAVCIPVLMFSQTKDSAELAVKETAIKILKEQKSIDSLKLLKRKEVLKQIAMQKKIREKIEELKSAKKIKSADHYFIVSEAEALQAVKPDNEAIYWEEIPRRWTGRFFNKDDTKIRMFRFENGRKVYLN